MKKIIITLLKSIGVILGIVAIYLIAVLLLPYIEISEKPTSEPKNNHGLYSNKRGPHRFGTSDKICGNRLEYACSFRKYHF